MNDDLRKAGTEFNMSLIRIIIKEAAENLKKHENEMKNYEGKPAEAGFVYLNPNEKMPTVEEVENDEGTIPPMHLVLHAHPDDPNLLFVVPLFEKWELERNEDHFEFHGPALVNVPNSDLIAHFNMAKWVKREEVESWHLCTVYDEWKWSLVCRKWRKAVFG